MNYDHHDEWVAAQRKLKNVPQKITRKAGITSTFPLLPLAYLNLAATAHVAEWHVAKWAWLALSVISLIGEGRRSYLERSR